MREAPDLTRAAWMLLGRMVDHGVKVHGHIRGTRYETSTRNNARTYVGRAKSVTSAIEAQLIRAGLIKEDKDHPDRTTDWKVIMVHTHEGALAWRGWAEGRPKKKQTTTPCHGCQSTVSHPTGDVCSECRSELRAGRVRIDSQQGSPADNVRIEVSVPQTPFPGSGGIDDRDLRHEFQKLVWEYLTTFTVKAERQYDPDRETTRLWSSPYSGVVWCEAWHGYIDPLLAHWIIRLEDVLSSALRRSYESGYESGGQLIRKLADGEVTLDEYEDRLARRRT